MKLLSKKTVAERLEVSPKTIDRMIETGEFPPATHVLGGGQTLRWMEPVVENWILLSVQRAPSSPKQDGQRRTTADNQGQIDRKQ